MSAQARKHLGGVLKSKIVHFDLGRAPTKQGTFASQHTAFHKTLVAAAKNKKGARFLEGPIDGNLENRGQRLVAHRRIGELVEHKDKSLGACSIGDEGQRVSPR